MRSLLLSALFFASCAMAQTVSYVPPPAAVYVSTTGLAGSWKPAAVSGSPATPLRHRPPPMALRCSSDGTGTAGTWESCSIFTAGTGTALNAPPPLAAYVGTSATGPWNPATGAAGASLASIPPREALFCSSDGSGSAGTWEPCAFAGGSGSVSKLPPVALYCSNDGTGNDTTWVPCAIPITTIISTVFNEGTPFTSITGTSPAVDVHGNLWATWPTTGSLQFSTGGAIATGPDGNVLNTGAASYTVTFSGLTNTATQFVSFSMRDATTNDRIDLQLLGAGGVALAEVVSGTSTTLQTRAVSAGATGSVVAVVHGTSISVTAFGQAPMLYTIPPGHGDIGGQFIGMLSSTFGYTFGGITVTVP